MKLLNKPLIGGVIVLVILIICIAYSIGNMNYSKTRASSSSENVSPVTIRVAWWGGDTRHEYTKKVIEKYEGENQHVRIEMEYANYDDYWKIMAPQAAAGELPDIMQIDTSYYAQYAGKGLFADLSPFFNEEINVSDINDHVLRAGEYGVGNYGMTLGINSLGFQYDPEMLKEAGITTIPDQWTWDTYEEMAVQAHKAGIYFDDGMRPEIFFAYFLRTKGTTLYNEQGTELGYSEDALFEDFFGRLIRLVHLGATPSAEDKAQVKDFTDNYLSRNSQIGIWQWSNQYVALQQAVNRPMKFANMVGPNMEAGLYLKSSMFFSIADSSKVKAEAAKFIDYWINDIEANRLILGERGVPISSKVQEAIKPYLSEVQQQVFDYVSWSEQHSSPGDPVDPVGSAEIIELLKSLWEKMEYEQITVEEAAQSFRTQATEILAKNK